MGEAAKYRIEAATVTFHGRVIKRFEVKLARIGPQKTVPNHEI